jgi:hypothetical protein
VVLGEFDGLGLGIQIHGRDLDCFTGSFDLQIIWHRLQVKTPATLRGLSISLGFKQLARGLHAVGR